jgi:hypothetical protein
MPVPAEPVPRVTAELYLPFVWPAGEAQRLVPRSEPIHVDVVSVMERRETRRDFSRPVSDEILGEFLWLACRSRISRPSQFGFDQESRPHPSAGAMHPIHILVGASRVPWRRYDPIEHALVALGGSAANADLVRRRAAGLLDVGNGLVLALAAEPGKTGAKYMNPESLVWRDAGVVLGYMSVVAEVLDVSFCPLGVTADAELSGLFGTSATLFGAGLAVLGG